MKSRGDLTPRPENAVAVPEEMVAVLMATSPSVLLGMWKMCALCGIPGTGTPELPELRNGYCRRPYDL